MEFLNPLFFILLPVYFIALWYFKKRFNRVAFSNLAMLERAAGKSFDFSKILKLLIALLMVISLANLVEKKPRLAKDVKGYDIAMLLDASYSMKEDNRFNRAKEVISNFISRRQNDNFALSLFANYAFVATPLTYDKESIRSVLNYLKLGVAGGRDTALYEALFLSTKLFKGKKQNRVMILLTDGINTVNSISLDSVLKEIKQKNIKVYTIALGKEGDYNKKALVKIAKSSGGKFYEALKPNELDLIYSEIDNLEKAKVKSKSYYSYRYFYKYPLVLALILIFIYAYFYRGNYSKTLLLLTTIFTLIALADPKLKDASNTLNSKAIFAIAIDLSKDMDAKDIYPSRLEFAKAKIKSLLEHLNGQRVALFGFSDKAYLISAPSSDYSQLKFLIKNLQPTGIEREKADITKLLKAVNKVIKTKPKQLLIFSSGGNKNLNKSAEFAKKHGIKVYAYATATKTGAAVEEEGKVLKNSRGDIYISKLNPAFKVLAQKSGGAFFKADTAYDLDTFIKSVSAKEAQKQANGGKKLYQIPLFIAFILFIFAIVRKRA